MNDLERLQQSSESLTKSLQIKQSEVDDIVANLARVEDAIRTIQAVRQGELGVIEPADSSAPPPAIRQSSNIEIVRAQLDKPKTSREIRMGIGNLSSEQVKTALRSLRGRGEVVYDPSLSQYSLSGDEPVKKVDAPADLSKKEIIIEALNKSEHGLRLRGVREKIRELGYSIKDVTVAGTLFQLKSSGEVLYNSTTKIYRLPHQTEKRSSFPSSDEE